MKKNSRGFSLIELLVAGSITVILSGVSIGVYVNQQRYSTLKNTAEEITNYLYSAKQKSIGQEEQSAWGLHFENKTDESGENDYYALFTGETYLSANEREKRLLSSSIEYANIFSGSSTNIGFDKKTGVNHSATNQSVIIKIKGTDTGFIITVNSEGVISVSTAASSPAVSAISPSFGINTGLVNISSVTGSNFQSGATVKLAKSGQTDIACTGFAFTNSTTLSNGSCPIAGAVAGQWNVVVVNPDAQIGVLSGGFTVTLPPPTVSSISPLSAINNASVAIASVAGDRFQSGAIVKLTKSGQTDISCAGFTFTNSTTLSNGSCPITGAAAGQWNVKVINPDLQTGTLTNGFTIILPPPSVSVISPSSGVNTASIAIASITGSNFQSGAIVKLTKSGQTDIACAGFAFTNSTTLSNGSCPIAGAVAGQWNVVVVNPDAQTGTLASGFTVTCLAPGQISDLAVQAGDQQNVLTWTAPSAGGNAISGYKIYRGESPGGETLLTPSPLPTTPTSYADTGLTNGTTYYYQASAVSSCGEGLLSNEVSGTPATFCTGEPNGTTCQATEYGSCGSCSYLATCSESGTGTQSVTAYTCQNQLCVSNVSSQPCTCTRSTNGTTCDTSTSCGSCSYSDVCDESASGTKTVYTCSSGSCVGQSASCTCTRNTNGDTCGSDWTQCSSITTLYTYHPKCSVGVCDNDYSYSSTYCGSNNCEYTSCVDSSTQSGSRTFCNEVMNDCDVKACTSACTADSYYCSGSTRYFRDYSCSAGSCSYSDTNLGCSTVCASCCSSSDCPSDYYLCSGSDQYKRDYSCVSNSCTYTDYYQSTCTCGCSGGSCSTVYSCSRCSDTQACRYANFKCCGSCGCSSPFDVSYSVNNGCDGLCPDGQACIAGSCQ
jgi:Tfp pilus assembly protein FimT